MTTVGAQVERIAGNVSAALAAIEAKGVEVPEGSTSDNLAPLISAIPEGGGLSGDFLADEDFLLALGIDPFEPEPTIKYLYENLDYIQSTGEQWIDTGFTPNQDTCVVMDAQSMGVNESVTGQSYFGARASSSNYFAAYWHRNNNSYYNFYGSSYSTKSSARITDRMIVTLDKGTLTVGDSITIARDYAEFTCPCTLYLFATNQAGTAAYQGVYRSWGCKVYDNGNLVRDFVPRRRKSDGAVGMLDLVSEVFYESASGVDFLAPGDLPAGYTQIEYIESTGSQYIDTGFVPNQDTKVVMEALIPSEPSSIAVLFGARPNEGSSSDCVMVLRTASGVVRSYYDDSYEDMSGVDSLARLSVLKDRESTNVNGVTVAHTYAEFSSACSLFLAAMNAGGTAKWHAPLRIYSCSAYDNDRAVRFYVPCISPDGEAGLFDFVTMTFYPSASSTAFVAGPEAA